jgi:hypothetical protein
MMKKRKKREKIGFSGFTLCAQPYRSPAHRRGADSLVQLALRAQSGRDIHPAHRGHRPGPLHQRIHRGDLGGHVLVGFGLGCGPGLPNRPVAFVPGSCGAIAPGRKSVSVLLLSGGIGGQTPAGPAAEEETEVRWSLPGPQAPLSRWAFGRSFQGPAAWSDCFA